MVEGGCRQRFAFETLDDDRFVDGIAGDDFDRNRPLQACVAPAIDLADAAGANETEHFVPCSMRVPVATLMFGPRRPDYTGCARPRRKHRVHARARDDDAQPAFDRRGASRRAGNLCS